MEGHRGEGKQSKPEQNAEFYGNEYRRARAEREGDWAGWVTLRVSQQQK